MDVNGQNRKDLLTKDNSIAMPRALAVLDSRLYLLDPKFEKLERYDLPKAEKARLIMDNEADLKTFALFKKRRASSHPCTLNNGGCDHLCLPSEKGSHVCACSIGFRKESDVHCVPYTSFAVVTQLDIARGYSFSDAADAMVPISGPAHHILHVDVHVADKWIYWVEFNRGIWNGIFR